MMMMVMRSALCLLPPSPGLHSLLPPPNKRDDHRWVVLSSVTVTHAHTQTAAQRGYAGTSGPKRLRINRISYEHPRRPGAVNRPHTADRETHQQG